MGNRKVKYLCLQPGRLFVDCLFEDSDADTIERIKNPAVIRRSRTYVSTEFIEVFLNSSVEFHEAEIKISSNDTVLKFYIGESAVIKISNGERTVRKLGIKPVIIEGDIYLPLRYIVEEFGGIVFWDDDNNSVTVIMR